METESETATLVFAALEDLVGLLAEAGVPLAGRSIAALALGVQTD